MKLPIDGNPARCMGLIAHPIEVKAFSLKENERVVFTVGGSDCTLKMWRLHPDVLDWQAAVQSGGVLDPDSIEPFISLLEGGRDGQLYSDLKDYF